ncbi:MAG TPA: ATP-binding cassette domain-containing protein, partial [Thermodesulfobacteriota bacterium]
MRPADDHHAPVALVESCHAVDEPYLDPLHLASLHSTVRQHANSPWARPPGPPPWWHRPTRLRSGLDVSIEKGKCQSLHGRAGGGVRRPVRLVRPPRLLTTIIGANGAGKSTLLRCVVGKLRPHRGRIEHDGRDLTRAATHELVRLGIAFVAQRHMVFPDLTV